MDIEGASHTDARAHELRMAQREIHAMIAAEAASGNGDARLGIPGMDERQRLMNEVCLVRHMPQSALPRGNLTVVPTFGVDAIEAISLQAAGIVLIADGGDHPALFVIVKTTHGSGKTTTGISTAVPVDEQPPCRVADEDCTTYDILGSLGSV